MHVWGGSSTAPERASSHLASDSEVEISAVQEAETPLTNWRGLVTVAAVALVGWPFISAGAVHGLWAELSRLMSFRRKP